MTKNTSSSYFLVFAALALFAVMMMNEVPVSMAACQFKQLSPCFDAISKPTISPVSMAACCKRLRSQVPCICTYAKDPNLRKYFTNPRSRRLAQTCKVAIPKC
ncbi:hypothetical protein MKW94_024689 [Papaver nudicaule]|uniref:Bifunctional inhibitor/plant lipid transfer protein/seed storage helical domain-containing protein n=1 Tax=Papaver nudicaule TaxID=74823 RepID=A0AA41RT39_PAPNU|nr:hypothetical protein [Papaver nudicaule]